MTVAELISILRTAPKTAEVQIRVLDTDDDTYSYTSPQYMNLIKDSNGKVLGVELDCGMV